MTKFKENNPAKLKEFLHQLTLLIDEYHPNIYLIDGVFKGVEQIEKSVREKLNDQNP